MDPWQLPRGLRVRRRKDLEAAGRVGCDQQSVGSAHRGVDGIACTERLAAALTGAVAGVQRIAAVAGGLHATLFGCEQAVADGEGAGLVELDCLRHVSSPSMQPYR